jgi:hypothetical protein
MDQNEVPLTALLSTSGMKYGLSQLSSFGNVTVGHNIPYCTSSEEHMEHLQIITDRGTVIA